jgi:hypothetical protein
MPRDLRQNEARRRRKDIDQNPMRLGKKPRGGQHRGRERRIAIEDEVGRLGFRGRRRDHDERHGRQGEQ